MRSFIDGGMRSGIPELAARERTITVYTDTAAFRDSLEIASSDTIQAYLVRRDGTVLWQHRGPATSTAASELAREVAVLDRRLSS